MQQVDNIDNKAEVINEPECATEFNLKNPTPIREPKQPNWALQEKGLTLVCRLTTCFVVSRRQTKRHTVADAGFPGLGQAGHDGRSCPTSRTQRVDMQ